MRKLNYILCILIFNIVFFTHSQVTNPLAIQPIRDMQWSPDGNFLAVAQHEGGLTIYDQQLTFLTGIYPQDTISSVSWSPDSQQLAVEHLGQLEILSWNSNQSILISIRVISSENPISSVAWSPMDDVVATAEIVDIDTVIDDLTFRNRAWATYYVATWNIQTGQMIMRTSESFRTRVERYGLNDSDEITYFKPIVWKPDSNKILLARTQDMGSYVQGQILTLDYQTGMLENTFVLPFEPITIALKPDSTIIAVTFDTGVVQIDVNDYQGFKSLHADGFQAVMSWSPDGRFLLVDGKLIDAINQDNIEVGETVIARFSPFPFSNEWHPYRPIIARGDLRGNLIIEDANEIEGFTASPIADAGESRIVYVGGDLTADVQLDASASVDYDGEIIGYEWYEGDNLLSIEMITTVNLPIGVYQIDLIVTDNEGLTDRDSIQIEVICKTVLADESLEDAITILFNQMEYDTLCLESEATYTLIAPLPTITGDITLISNGASIVMTGTGRVFDVASTGGLTLKNLSVSGGDAVQGGAIYNAGVLTLEDVVLEGNIADEGGAIYNIGTLTMRGGALQNNVGRVRGGGIYNAGDMDLDGVNIRDNDASDVDAIFNGQGW